MQFADDDARGRGAIGVPKALEIAGSPIRLRNPTSRVRLNRRIATLEYKYSVVLRMTLYTDWNYHSIISTLNRGVRAKGLG
jgi:hypothetical protein